MKYIFILMIAAITIYPQETVYFRVFAEVKNDAVFKRILQETNLVDVFPEKFQMVLNAGGKEPFVVIGRYNSRDVEFDPEAFRYDWSFFNPVLQDMIMKCKDKIYLR